MSNNDPLPNTINSNASQNILSKQPQSVAQRRSLFTIPPPLKRIFDKTPLITYTENELPLRAPTGRDENTLFIFTTEEDAKYGRPSFNPACLKWQTYLKICGIPLSTVSSCNHASPSGALPFLLPASTSTDPLKASNPVPSNKLKRWVSSRAVGYRGQEPSDVRCVAYDSLLDNCIRKAWLYQLYLSPANASVAHALYVRPSSSNLFVQMTIAYQLRRAAESEIKKAAASTTVIETDIMREAEEALDALSTLLGHDDWFFGHEKPTLFDASVFAYTHLILNSGIGWKENRLAHHLEKHGNLVNHQERVWEMYS